MSSPALFEHLCDASIISCLTAVFIVAVWRSFDARGCLSRMLVAEGRRQFIAQTIHPDFPESSFTVSSFGSVLNVHRDGCALSPATEWRPAWKDFGPVGEGCLRELTRRAARLIRVAAAPARGGLWMLNKDL